MLRFMSIYRSFFEPTERCYVVTPVGSPLTGQMLYNRTLGAVLVYDAVLASLCGLLRHGGSPCGRQSAASVS